MVRAELEGLCARLAARRATPEQTERIRATQLELKPGSQRVMFTL
nr:FCD domain-containing protein [Trinickia symbiotica]